MSVYDTDQVGLRGLQTVRVRKSNLQDIVQKNRDEHRAIFEEAIDGWKVEAVRQLERAVEDARQGREFQQRIAIPRPQDHTVEYDQVLKMLDMSLDDELELSAREFQMFVMDQWGWQQAFLTAATNYGSERASDKNSNL